MHPVAPPYTETTQEVATPTPAPLDQETPSGIPSDNDGSLSKDSSLPPTSRPTPSRPSNNGPSRKRKWELIHVADSRDNARAWMHKNSETTLVWKCSINSNQGTAYRCKDHERCPHQTKVFKPKVRCFHNMPAI